MKILLPALIYSLLMVSINAQVYNGNITLHNQIEIDSFNYTSVNGFISIVSTNAANLDGLSGLISVSGDLYIWYNPFLKNIDGLSNLTSVGGRIQILDNDLLNNIDGLSGLKSVGDLVINQNDKITSITKLNNLTHFIPEDKPGVLGGLIISGNNALKTVNGLSNVSSIPGRIKIESNVQLTTVNALLNLSTAGTDLMINNNWSLTDIDFLSNLRKVGNDLSVTGNSILTDIDALNKIDSIGGSLYIGNRDLKNLNGLSNLKVINRDLSISGPYTNINGLSQLNFIGGNLEISFNTDLPDVDGLTSLKYIGGRLTISENEMLSNINGLHNLSKLGDWLVITDNKALTNIDGLSNLDSVVWISCHGNSNLQNVNGLSGVLASEVVFIYSNPKLKEFCGLYNILISNTEANVWLDNNGINPTLEQIIIGGPCIQTMPSFICAMLGKKEIPSVPVNASGGGMFILNETHDSLQFWIRVCGLSGKIISADFNHGGKDKTGPVVKTITDKFSGNIARGVWTSSDGQPLTATLADDLIKGNIYVNIRTELNPSGEIRGQISSDEVVRLYAHLNGHQETPPNDVSGIGEASFVLSGDGKLLEYYIFNQNLTSEISVLHFNNAPVQVSGPVVKTIPFLSEYLPLRGRWTERSTEPLTPELVADLLGCNIYVNIITQNYPDGEVRGQIYQGSVESDTSIVWKIQVKGTVKNISDEKNYAGVSADALEGFDYQFESPEPPAPPTNFIRVYFPHPEWNNNLGRDYANDIRSIYNIKDTLKTWLFEVQSNVKDTVKLYFVKYNFPDSTYSYFSDLSKTVRNIPLPSEYRYYNTSSEPKRFLLVVGDTSLSVYSTVELLKPNGGEVWRSNSDKIIQWKLPESKNPDSIYIYSIKNSTDTALIGKTIGNVNELVWHTPNEYWNNNYKIKIAAIDSTRNTGTDESDGTFTIAGDSLARKSRSGFSLISIPLEPNDSSGRTIFEDDLAASSYFIYSFSKNDGYKTPAYIKYGEGYWLTLDQESTWDVKGKVLEDDSTIIDLKQGYNLIGNRYVRDLRRNKDLFFLHDGSYYNFRDAVKNEIITGNLYSSNNNSSDILIPFEGYWLGVIKTGVRLVEHLPLIQNKNEDQTDSSDSQVKWQVHIAVRSGDYSDKDNKFGIANNATAGYDGKYDSPEPPLNPVGNNVNLWFDIPDNKHAELFGNKFSHEFRAPNDINFRFFVESAEEKDLVINWDNSLVKNLSDVLLLLIDSGKNKTINMLEVNEYSFQNTGTREFIIKGSLLTDAKENEIPESYYLRQNYPNPFNPATRIEYGLPEKSFVSIAIYDITGSEIQLLVNEEQSAGKYVISWKPQSLASGLYLCRI